MSKGKLRPAAQRPKPWWSKRRNRNNVWLGLLGVLGVAAAALFVWFATVGGTHTGGGQPIVAGAQVQAFELPDVVSGGTFSLGDYLGKKDIVLVSYMGFF